LEAPQVHLDDKVDASAGDLNANTGDLNASDSGTGPRDASAGADAACEGACVQCRGDSDCAPQGECWVGVCGAGSACEQRPVDRGVRVAQQVPFDCRVHQCDGAGGTEAMIDDSDVAPDDGLGCVFPACSGGTPSESPRPAGVECGDGETQCSGVDRCDGEGACALNHALDAQPCDDGLFCTLTDSCRTGVCAGTGEVCTPQRNCDEGSNRCLQCTEDRDCDGFCGPDRPGSCDDASNGCRC
jgi:hypothetical protein